MKYCSNSFTLILIHFILVYQHKITRTHLQILIEESKLAEVLQIVVLLPSTVCTFWMAPPFPAAPPVSEKSETQTQRDHYVFSWT